MSIADELRRLANNIEEAYVVGTSEAYKEGVKNAFDDMKAGELDDELAEMGLVRLPMTADGYPAHPSEVLYGSDGDPFSTSSFTLTASGWTEADLIEQFWHDRPEPADSLERIADELEEWSDGADVDGDACDVPHDLANRIRKLAEKEGDE